MMNYLRGKPVEIPKIGSDATISYPSLVTADWCPFTIPAIGFWKKAAHSVGLSLNILYVDSEQGAKALGHMIVAGVPCLIANPKALFYGLQTTSTEAISFLKEYAQ
jgi:hypothetical protein